jgi:hypothetical protein
MNAVSPVMPGSEPIEIVLGKDQPEYIPLPAVYLNAPAVPMVTRWRLTDEERAAVTEGADLVFTQLTFGMPFQPVHFQVTMPDEMPILVGVE